MKSRRYDKAYGIVAIRLNLTSRGTSDERNGKINGGDECRLVNDVTEVRGTFVNRMRDMGGLAM